MSRHDARRQQDTKQWATQLDMDLFMKALGVIADLYNQRSPTIIEKWWPFGVDPGGGTTLVYWFMDTIKQMNYVRHWAASAAAVAYVCLRHVE